MSLLCLEENVIEMIEEQFFNFSTPPLVRQNAFVFESSQET